MPVDAQLVTDAAAALGVTVKEPLAEGGQKSVLLCDRSGETVVMKVIANSPKLPDGLRRATREVELLKKTDHPNVVKVASDLIELGEPADAAAWLEQFLDGEDLKDALQGQWDWGEAKAMGLDVARGLSALHAGKVVHRDLSAKKYSQADEWLLCRHGPWLCKTHWEKPPDGHGAAWNPRLSQSRAPSKLLRGSHGGLGCVLCRHSHLPGSYGATPDPVHG